MKVRKLGFYIVLAVILILSACGTGGQQTADKNEKPNQENDAVEAEIPSDNVEADTKSNTETNAQLNGGSEANNENTAFQNIEVSGENGEYVVKGEARVFEGVFYYTVEDGDDYLVEETNVTVNNGAPAWSPFEIKISIPEDQLPLNGTITLELFEKSAQDNSIMNQSYVKLDEFGY